MSKGMYAAVESLKELNKVEGFNPEEFLRPSEENPEDLILAEKVKMVWFRLKYPTGKVRKIIHKADTVSAIVEVRLYADASDDDFNFIANGISQRYNDNTSPMGLHYLSWAVTSATSQALDDAGFGIQFSDLAGNNKSDVSGEQAKTPENNAAVETKNENRVANQEKPQQPQTENGKPHLSVVADAEEKEQEQQAQTEAEQTTLSGQMSAQPKDTKPVETEKKENNLPVQVQDQAVVQQSKDEDKSINNGAVATENGSAQAQTNNEPSETMKNEPTTKNQPDNAPKDQETGQADEAPAELPAFHPMTPVNKILPHMTTAIALAIKIPTGIFKDYKLGDAIAQKPEILDFYATGYHSDNRIKAAAMFLKEQRDNQTA